MRQAVVSIVLIVALFGHADIADAVQISAGDRSAYTVRFDQRGVPVEVYSPREVAPERLYSGPSPGGRGNFLPNIQVDDGVSPEHRMPVVVFDGGGSLLLTYAERAAHYNPEYIMFTRSDDGGMTWDMPATIVNDVSHNADIMPSIARLADGTIGVVWCAMHFAPFNYEIFFAASTDGGATFGPNVVVHPPDASTDFLRPWITAAGNTFYVGYVREIEAYTGYIEVVSSTDGGATWSTPVTVDVTHPIGNDGEPPKIVHNPVLDDLAVVWESYEGIWISLSHDSGVTWEIPSEITDPGTVYPDYPEMAVDSNGRYVVVWGDFRDDWVDVFIDFSMDGESWGTDRRINDLIVSGNQYEPHITIDPNDVIHVIWDRNIPFDFNVDLYYTHSMDGGLTWYEPNPRVNDVPSALTPYVTWSSDLVADESGKAYIFWNDGRENDYYDHIYFTRTDDITPAPIAVRFLSYETTVGQGETLDFTVGIANVVEVEKEFDAWLDVYLPGSIFYQGNPLRKVTLTLPPGAAFQRDLRLPVGEGVPTWTFELFGRVGRWDAESPDVWSEDSFEFTVE